MSTGKALLAALLLTAGTAQAADPWTRQDVALQATYATLHVLDWGQTRYIADHPREHYERNPILGRHPSRGRVDAYFATTLALHTLVTHLLPARAETFGVEWSPRTA